MAKTIIKKSRLLFLILGLIIMTSILISPKSQVMADFSNTAVSVPGTAPSIANEREDPASTTSTPTDIGTSVTFKATGTSPHNYQYYLAICTTNAVTAGNDTYPTCDVGTWCKTTSPTNSGDPASCTYAVQPGDAESNAWFAFVCDKKAGSALCSTGPEQGSGDGSGSPFEVNHRPTFTAFTDDSPKNPDQIVTFSTSSTDTDTGATVTLYVCKSASFTAPATCNGGQWCNSSAVSSNPSCQYDDSDNIFQDDDWGAYGYIVDDHGLVSTDVKQGNNTIMTINNVAPSISASSIQLLDTDGADELVPKTEQGWTQDFLVNFIVTDYNSCVNVSSTDEIASAILHVYRSGITSANCDGNDSDNTNNCYQNAQSGTGGQCYQYTTYDPCTGASDSTVGWRCEFPLEYNVDPTVATNTKFPSENWLTSVKATDDDSANTGLVEDADGNDMDKFSSYDLNTGSVDYGSVAPDAESAEKTVVLEATGNVGLDAEYSGTDMSYSTSTPIAVSQQKYDLTGSKTWTNMVYTLSASSTEQELNCLKTTVSGSPETKNTYFKLKVPLGQDPGDYAGTDTFVGIEGESAGW